MLRTDSSAGAEPIKAKRDATTRGPAGSGATSSPFAGFSEELRKMVSFKFHMFEPASVSADA